MNLMKISHFSDFYHSLKEAGFSMGGSNAEGIFSLNQLFSEQIVCHSGDEETDSWQWRIRAVTEKNDIVYGKIFLNKSGFISLQWLPYFLAVRRNHMTFDEMYQEGKMNYLSKEIYKAISENPSMSSTDISNMTSVGAYRKSQIDSALTSLQMKLFIMVNGQTHKVSSDFTPYGWPVTTFCTIEEHFGEKIIEKAKSISKAEAEERIMKQILKLNESATDKAMKKFIEG